MFIRDNAMFICKKHGMTCMCVLACLFTHVGKGREILESMLNTFSEVHTVFVSFFHSRHKFSPAGKRVLRILNNYDS